MSFYEPAFDGEGVVPTWEDDHNFDDPTPADISATEIYARLLAMAQTPGQVAAVQSVCRMDERRPCEIALSLRMSRQRFNQLTNQARKRMALLVGGLDRETA